MEATIILPVLDMAKLQEKANEYAMAGAMKTMEEFYTGYNSPYRKAIEEAMKNKDLSYPIELPDIIGIINDKLGRAVEEIANRAIGETYVPLVQRMLTRVDKQVYFSDILKEFVELTDAKDIDDCELDMNLDAGYGWYRVSIAHKDAQYEFTLHNHVKAGKEKGKLFQLLGIPTCTGWPDKYSQPKMKFKVEGSAEIEMPWTQDILRDKFTSYMASIALSDAEIIVDKTYFEDEMFPTHCHCD